MSASSQPAPLASGQTVFQYAVTANTGDIYITNNPTYPSLVTLNIQVSNQSGSDVACPWIGFIISIGTGQTDLTASASGISAVSQQTDWSIASDSDGSYRAVPVAPNTGLANGATISFQLGDIVVNQMDGFTEFGIAEMTSARNSTSIQLQKVESSLSIASFYASPPNINPGDSCILNWQTTDAAACMLYEGGINPQTVSTNGNLSVSPAEDTTYTLVASGKGALYAYVPVTVVQATILSFHADPLDVGLGQASTLTWTTVNATECTLDDMSVPVNGSQVVNPSETTAYTLTASGSGGTSASQQFTVTVDAPAIQSFTASPNPMYPTQTTELNWATEYATSASISPNVGDVGVNGSCPVSSLDTTTTFTLTCQGYDGPVQQSVTVTVNPPVISSFTVKPSFIFGSAKPPIDLAWSTEYSTGVTLTFNNGDTTVSLGGPYPPSGTMTVPAGQGGMGTYTLTCLGYNPPVTSAKSVLGPMSAASGAQDAATGQGAGIVATGTTVFQYDVEPNTGQIYITRNASYPSLVTLNIAVLNNSGGDVACPWIGFTIPIGTGPTDLTLSAFGIVAISQQSDWSIASDGDGTFRAIPVSPNTGLANGAGVSFQLQNIAVNQVVGPTELDIAEMTSARNDGSALLQKIQSPLSIDSFTATPAEISPGSESVLAWQTTDAASCTLTPAGENPSVPTNGNQPVSPPEDTTYTLSAFGQGPPLYAQVTVTVERVTILSFDASPLTVGLDQPATLSWTTLNATGCTLDPGGMSVSVNGSQVVNPSQTTTYSLTASGIGPSPIAQITVTVSAPVILSFTASPDTIYPGQPVQLNWTTEYATSASISPNVGAVPVNGSYTVSDLTSTTTFTITCQGYGGPVQQSVTVNVKPVMITSFQATPAALTAPGQSSVLSWTTGGAISCSIEPEVGTVPSNGQTTVTPPGWIVYTLTAQGSQGPASESIIVSMPGGPYVLMGVVMPQNINPEVMTQVNVPYDQAVAGRSGFGVFPASSTVTISGSNFDGVYTLFGLQDAGSESLMGLIVQTPYSSSQAASGTLTIKIGKLAGGDTPTRK